MSQDNPQASYDAAGAPSPGAPVQAYATPAPAPGAQPDVVKRFLAYFIDGIILSIIAQITIFGAAAALAGWLARDVVWEGNSVGKKLMGLRAVSASGAPVTLNESVLRNLPFAIGAIAVVLSKLTIVGALLALPVALLSLVVVLAEAFFVLTNQPRIGDRLAHTHVVTEARPAVA